MGNNHSAQISQIDSFYDTMDYIAAHYILTTKFDELTKLSNKQYCDNLVDLSAHIIGKSSPNSLISWVETRISSKNDNNHNKNTTMSESDSNILSELDKKHKCIKISMFYVKIAHLFAAILTTINPVTSYKNSNGDTKKRLNLCDKRISDLNILESQLLSTNDSLNLPPTFCDSQPKTLGDEPGMNEFKQLYYDKYNFETNSFTDMMPDTQKQFELDLKTVYSRFTGNSLIPDSVKSFSDIHLKDYNRSGVCQQTNAVKNKTAPILIQYSDSIRNMIKTASEKQSQLLTIIDALFIFVSSEKTDNEKIKINPKLTMSKLNVLIKESRKLIMDLYLGCERDYDISLKLYETILETQVFETTKKQIQYMEQELRNITLKNAVPNVIPNPGPNAIPNPGPKVIPEPEPNVIPNPGPNAIPNPDPNVIPNPDPNVIPNPDPKVIPEPEPNVIPNPDPNVIPNPDSNVVPNPDPNSDIRSIHHNAISQHNKERQEQLYEQQLQLNQTTQNNQTLANPLIIL
jgi:hypothetical protein